MTEKLHDELVRIGDAAPRAAVPGDVWARGRRARRRDRVVAGGAVLSVLLVLGGLGLVLGVSDRHDAPPVSTGGGAVPSVIRPVPVRLTTFAEGADETWKPSVAETDLATGRASVAFGSGSESQTLPVVITAADGRYHLLRLPGWIGHSLAAYQSGGSALALSPDGRQLAWGWYDRSSFHDASVAAGVRVADLETGRIRTIPLSGGRGVAVGAVAWSPDSRWLVWQGIQLKTWERNATGWQRNVAGRIAPGATTSQPIVVSRGGDEQLAIDDWGTVGRVEGSGYSETTVVGGGGDVTDILEGRPVVAGLFGRSDTLALATTQPAAAATFLLPPQGRRPAQHRGSIWASVQTQDIPASRSPAMIQPVGWVDVNHVVELVTPVQDYEPDTGWTSGDSELAVMSLRDGDQPAYDVVARVEQGDEGAGRIQDVTVAVDLMSLDQPTRDFPAPEWPWSDERRAAVFGGIAVGVLAVLVFAVAYRRARRLR